MVLVVDKFGQPTAPAAPWKRPVPNGTLNASSGRPTRILLLGKAREFFAYHTVGGASQGALDGTSAATRKPKRESRWSG
jgi:hypothetical protein